MQNTTEAAPHGSYRGRSLPVGATIPSSVPCPPGAIWKECETKSPRAVQIRRTTAATKHIVNFRKPSERMVRTCHAHESERSRQQREPQMRSSRRCVVGTTNGNEVRSFGAAQHKAAIRCGETGTRSIRVA